MFCCACNIESEDTENEGINWEHSLMKDKSENIEIDDVSTKERNGIWIDRTSISESDSLEQKKNLDDVTYLKLNLDDVRYLKWHDRSKRTLIFLESQFMSEMERRTIRARKKKITLKKILFWTNYKRLQRRSRRRVKVSKIVLIRLLIWRDDVDCSN